MSQNMKDLNPVFSWKVFSPCGIQALLPFAQFATLIDGAGPCAFENERDFDHIS
jgi:hypothetical protein